MGSVSQPRNEVTRSISKDDLENLILTKVVESLNMHNKSSPVHVHAKLVKAELQKQQLERRANALYRQIQELTKAVKVVYQQNAEMDNVKPNRPTEILRQRLCRSVGLQVNLMPSPVKPVNSTKTVAAAPSSSKNVPAATSTPSTTTSRNNKKSYAPKTYASKRVQPYSSNRVTRQDHLPPFPTKTTLKNNEIVNIPRPELSVEQKNDVVVLTWKHASESQPMIPLKSYQMFAYYELSPSSQKAKNFVWRDIGTVQALILPMSCTLTELVLGRRYYFILRGIDQDNREGPFSNVVKAQLG